MTTVIPRPEGWPAAGLRSRPGDVTWGPNGRSARAIRSGSRPVIRRGFRFRPPGLVPSPELDWVLASTFAASAPPVDPGLDLARALEIADALTLLPRLAFRLAAGTPGLAGGEPGGPGERLRAERIAATARELALDEALAAAVEAATEAGTLVGVLKGRALVVAGELRAGERPSGDLDLLVPEGALPALAAALARRGFTAHGGSRPHHPPPLRSAGGATIELHRHLPGVRLERRRAAGWRDLEGAGLLAPPPGAPTGTPLRLPAPAVRRAHALVHGLAQHAFAPRFPGWLLIGDLLALADSGREPEADWRRWVAREISPREIDAALALAGSVAAGRDPWREAGDAALLARHFTAAALDADYAAALRWRDLATPFTAGSALAGRLRALAGAFVPPTVAGERPARRAGRWVGRPFDLVARSFTALAATRRLRRRGPDEET